VAPAAAIPPAAAYTQAVIPLADTGEEEKEEEEKEEEERE